MRVRLWVREPGRAARLSDRLCEVIDAGSQESQLSLNAKVLESYWSP